MPKEQNAQFVHRNTILKENNEIATYEIEIRDIPSKQAITLQIKPSHLISHISMKRILLERGIFYSAGKQEHIKSIEIMFETSKYRKENGQEKGRKKRIILFKNYNHDIQYIFRVENKSAPFRHNRKYG